MIARAAFACSVVLAVFLFALVGSTLVHCGGVAFTESMAHVDAGDVLEQQLDAGGDVLEQQQLDAGDGDAAPVCMHKTVWDPRPCESAPTYADHGRPFACEGQAGDLEYFEGTAWCCIVPDAACPAGD